MRMSTWNKKEETVICLYCKKNKVPRAKWNRPCLSCKKKMKPNSDLSVNIGKELPAAILKDENGIEKYVDKNGNKVENPGYDTKNDPRGYKFTGKQSKKIDFIL